MTQVQKIIKYFAIAFAFALILAILSCIMYAFSLVSNFFFEEESKITETLKDINVSSDDVSVLDIDISYANLIIKSGDTLKAKTNNKYITTSSEGNKLVIKEKKHSWFKKSDSDLIVYIPQDFIFDGIRIDAGAGKVEIDSLSTKVLEFDIGAGKTIINNLLVLGTAEIDGGAGEFTISNGSINNLDLDTGVGNFTLTSKLIGKNEIDVGVGKLNITLLGSLEEYKITVEKGIGSIKLNDENIKSNMVYGTGINSIDISGGIGSIDINFKKLN